MFLREGASVDAGVAQITAIAQTILRQLPPGQTPPLVIRYNASTVPILQTLHHAPAPDEVKLEVKTCPLITHLRAHGREIVPEIKKTTNKPIRFLFNTHYHSDHSFGNGVFMADSRPGQVPAVYLAKHGRVILDRERRTVEMALDHGRFIAELNFHCFAILY